MISLRRLVTSAVAAAAVLVSPLGYAQTDIEKKIGAQYTLTKATADRTDIVTAGSVLVLQKDSLLMDTSASRMPVSNTYQGGKLSHGAGDVVSHSRWIRLVPGASYIPGVASANVDTRKFVAGEKFWVTKITVQDDGVVFELFSDPILNLRYYADLKFPFPKGSPPLADQMLSTIAEVLKVQPADDFGGDPKPAAVAGASTLTPPPPPPPSAAAMAPIAPPSPPTDAPPPQPQKLEIGQTKDQVVAMFGQPMKIASIGSKEIDYYPDFKVTIEGGRVTKVADVQ
jgi:hypothetical protein